MFSASWPSIIEVGGEVQESWGGIHELWQEEDLDV